MPQIQPYLVNVADCQELRFIKYWLKIHKMDHDSFLRQCYEEMYKTDSQTLNKELGDQSKKNAVQLWLWLCLADSVRR